jgi:hypothetical protein
MVLWSLPDGGPSHSRPLLGSFESMQGGTPDTNSRQQAPSAWQVSRCWVIWIYLVHGEFAEYSFHEPTTLAQNHSVLSCGDQMLFCRVDQIGAPHRCTY